MSNIGIDIGYAREKLHRRVAALEYRVSNRAVISRPCLRRYFSMNAGVVGQADAKDLRADSDDSATD